MCPSSTCLPQHLTIPFAAVSSILLLLTTLSSMARITAICRLTYLTWKLLELVVAAIDCTEARPSFLVQPLWSLVAPLDVDGIYKHIVENLNVGRANS